MTSEERIKKQKEMIEEMGRHFDKEGFQPIAGRIMGLLMVMDKEQFSFDEIVEELKISKSSASNALHNLEIRGKIEYITLPGDRKRYFQMRRNDISNVIDEIKEKIQKTSWFMERIIELKADKNSRNAKFFIEMNQMLSFMQASIDKSMKAYLKNN